MFGEHVVVLGKTALASALDLRTYVKVAQEAEGRIDVKLPHTTFSFNLADIGNPGEIPPIEQATLSPALLNAVEPLCSADQHGIFKQAMVSLLFMYLLAARDQRPGVSIEVKSQVPFGVGLGSSAAYNTSLAAALLRFFRPELFGEQPFGELDRAAKDVVNNLAFQGEKIMHGNPSGIDNTVSVLGGMIAYTSGGVENLVDVPLLKLIVTNTKISRNTKQLVAKVGTLNRMFPSVTGPLLDSVHHISQNVLTLFREYPNKRTEENLLEIESQLEIFISMNHNILGALGVGHPALDRICHISNQNHMQSKLTGAGGGGCAFTLVKKNIVPSKVTTMISELEAAGFECFPVNIGGKGLQYHDLLEIPPLPNFLPK
uniref:Mevalonate kinase n=1 Tax=Arcella intermedia TaxID=1963864 RepID=A0A6B2L6X3_9EUKA